MSLRSFTNVYARVCMPQWRSRHRLNACGLRLARHRSPAASLQLGLSSSLARSLPLFRGRFRAILVATFCPLSIFIVLRSAERERHNYFTAVYLSELGAIARLVPPEQWRRCSLPLPFPSHLLTSEKQPRPNVTNASSRDEFFDGFREIARMFSRS